MHVFRLRNEGGSLTLPAGCALLPPQVMRRVMEDQCDSTQLCLLFANKTEADILLRERLQEASEVGADRACICAGPAGRQPQQRQTRCAPAWKKAGVLPARQAFSGSGHFCGSILTRSTQS